jgi:hypothetical protein
MKAVFRNKKIKKITQFKRNQMHKRGPSQRKDDENYVI